MYERKLHYFAITEFLVAVLAFFVELYATINFVLFHNQIANGTTDKLLLGILTWFIRILRETPQLLLILNIYDVFYNYYLSEKKNVLRLPIIFSFHGPSNGSQTVLIQLISAFLRFDSILNLVISVTLERNLNDYLSKKISERAQNEAEVKHIQM